MKCRLVIVDDHAMLRQGLIALMNSRPEFEVVGEASGGLEGIRVIRETRPDVAIIDISMPDLNGIEATRRISTECPDTRVLALSMHENRRFVIDMLKAGAAGYMVKSSGVDELTRAVKSVCSGVPYISPHVASVVVEGLGGRRKEFQSPASALTPRELQVLQLLADGKRYREIAEHLEISEKTVQSHRSNISKKLKIGTLPELTKFALQNGLTSLDGG